jgi:hypothetical protein
MVQHILATGQQGCYDSSGKPINCDNSGQEGEVLSGCVWPQPRFEEIDQDLVRDLVTGLIWPRNANLFEFPATWQEAFNRIQEMNAQHCFERTDWRMPNRRELRSLISHGARNPALPREHPFRNVFLGWYWTSTSAAIAPSYAWYLHLAGGRMFYGNKNSEYLLLPVCGESVELAATGQLCCYDSGGRVIDCKGSGQDGELQKGVAWPRPRFSMTDVGIEDHLSNCLWHPKPLFDGACNSWKSSLAGVLELRRESGLNWRMPTINELETLVDSSAHTPALPVDFPGENLQEAYWSSTTSFYEPEWAYVLYLHKGAVGVGFKANRDFPVWPVLTDYHMAVSGSTTI